MKRYLLLVAFLAPKLASAQCIMQGLRTAVATLPVTKIAAGGGVVVVAHTVMGDSGEREPGNHPEWKVQIGDKALAPKIETIAPGLYVYRIAGDGVVTLLDEKGTERGHATVTTAKPAEMPAPKLAKLESIKQYRGYHTTDTVTATLAEDPPADAYAIVLADAKTGKPLSWHEVAAGNKVQRPYEHSDCAQLPNGSSEAKAGTTATVFWVTFDGRVSARTKPIKIDFVPVTR